MLASKARLAVVAVSARGMKEKRKSVMMYGALFLPPIPKWPQTGLD